MQALGEPLCADDDEAATARAGMVPPSVHFRPLATTHPCSSQPTRGASSTTKEASYEPKKPRPPVKPPAPALADVRLRSWALVAAIRLSATVLPDWKTGAGKASEWPERTVEQVEQGEQATAGAQGRRTSVSRLMSLTPTSALPMKRMPATSPLPVTNSSSCDGDASASAAVASRKCVPFGSCSG